MSEPQLTSGNGTGWDTSRANMREALEYAAQIIMEQASAPPEPPLYLVSRERYNRWEQARAENKGELAEFCALTGMNNEQYEAFMAAIGDALASD